MEAERIYVVTMLRGYKAIRRFLVKTDQEIDQAVKDVEALLSKEAESGESFFNKKCDYLSAVPLEFECYNIRHDDHVLLCEI